MVANGLEVPIVGAAFLLSMHWALTGIHVEDHAVGSVQRLDPSDHLAVEGHQSDEILLARQQLRLEPVQRRRERRTAVQILGDPINRNAGSAASLSASLRSS